MRPKIILDTDLGPDCDDAVALAILNRLHNEKKVEFLGLTYTSDATLGLDAAYAINEYYGNPSLPIGYPSIENAYHLPKENYYFLEELAAFKKSEKSYVMAVKFLREMLSKHQGLTYVSIGTLNNIEDLMRSEPDEISPLSGLELMKRNLGSLFIMGGDFPSLSKKEGEIDLEGAEYNLKCHLKSAQYVIRNLCFPTYFVDFHTGLGVYSGGRYKKKAHDNPLAIAIDNYPFADSKGRDSFDPVTVLAATRLFDQLFSFANIGDVTIDEAGVTSFARNPHGLSHIVLFTKEKEEVGCLLDSLI